MRKLAAVAILGAAAWAARRYLSMRDALADVPAELRSPQMAILSIPCTAKTLPIFRGASRLRTNAGRGVTVIKRSIGEPAIRVLLTTPSEGQSPCPAVLWIHGGGCVLGSPQMEAFGTGRLARDLGVVTVSPDYRLAAEHPFPAALDDCMTTLRWMFANADELGIDPDRIAVMGASAGGGLSAAVAQRSHDEGIPLRASAGIPDARRPHRAA